MKNSQEFSSRKDWERYLWKEVINYLVDAKGSWQMQKRVESLFSEYECDLVMRRLTALLLLKEGKSYKEIGALLWISSATISSLRKNLKSAKYRGRTRNARLTGKKYIPQKPVAYESRNEKSMSFMDLLLHLQESYTNPKKRWDFLRRI